MRSLQKILGGPQNILALLRAGEKSLAVFFFQGYG
jgi:hypothetical protein